MTTVQTDARPAETSGHGVGAIPRTLLIGLIAFFTVVDLFGTQAILPALTTAYGVTPAAMGFAVNATTLGMAVACLGAAYASPRADARRGIVGALLLLAVPTTLLAFAPNLATFTVLRIAQGLCMATGFTLTLAYLGEYCSGRQAGGAFAAYIAGNVASNLFGRFLAAGLADHLGLAATFYGLAALNLAGAALVAVGLTHRKVASARPAMTRSIWSIWAEHLGNPVLRPTFAIGFCILFAFIGTFTYVNFVLVREPLSVSPMGLGTVYLVFGPAIATTLLAGRAVERVGSQRALWASLGLAGAGLPLLVAPNLPSVLTGLTLVGIGTFFAQATATSFVSRAATADRGSASGIYLASYFCGGLLGSLTLGQVFDRFGWAACVAGIGLALAAAALLAVRLTEPLPAAPRAMAPAP